MSENSPALAPDNCPIITSTQAILPGAKVQFLINNPHMAEAVQKALDKGGQIFITAPKDPAQAYTSGQIGAFGLITKSGLDANQNPMFVFEAMIRGRLLRTNMDGTTTFATVARIARQKISGELMSLTEKAGSNFLEYLEAANSSLDNIKSQVQHLDKLRATEPYAIADYIASQLNLDPDKKRALLQSADIKSQLDCVIDCLDETLVAIKLKRDMEARARGSAEEDRRRYLLKKQQQEIAEELGEGEGGDNEELDKLTKKIYAAGMPPEALKKCESDLKRLRRMPPSSMDANVLINALEWMTSLPWSKKSEVVKDLNRAEEILDADHYGLKDPKDAILEYLAVQQLSDKAAGRIICLVGPPGVGKTSLGKSIARATGREFLRIALGGVRDESHVRGHRPAYVGAAPGTIITGMKNAGTINPVIQLDEIDKLGQGGGMQGDPSAAMLEVLDPKQNNAFKDHYLGVNYDLSQALFICTANDLSTIPGPLRDRMEFISIPGYTLDEKFEIAKRHLISNQLKETGLTSSQFSISDAALRYLIENYTSEAGVRSLERKIGRLASKVARQIVAGSKESVAITPANIEEYLGVPRGGRTLVSDSDKVGYVNGLYWSPTGGGVLPIEAVKIPTGGKSAPFTMTGQLGDVMKESIKVAEMFVRSQAGTFGITTDTLDNNAVHIHAPAGAIPKDGPSAGLAMVTSIVSVLTGIPVNKNIAMTGEVGLLGEALPIGGLKEKLLGAVMAGATKVLIPQENVKDLAEVPENVKSQLEIVSVKTVMEVLQHALVTPLVPLSENANLPRPALDRLQTMLRGLDDNTLKAMFDIVAAAQQKLPEPANDVQPRATAPGMRCG